MRTLNCWPLVQICDSPHCLFRLKSVLYWPLDVRHLRFPIPWVIPDAHFGNSTATQDREFHLIVDGVDGDDIGNFRLKVDCFWALRQIFKITETIVFCGN